MDGAAKPEAFGELAKCGCGCGCGCVQVGGWGGSAHVPQFSCKKDISAHVPSGSVGLDDSGLAQSMVEFLLADDVSESGVGQLNEVVCLKHTQTH